MHGRVKNPTRKKELTPHLTEIDELAQPGHILHDKVPVVDSDDHDDADPFQDVQ